MTELNLQGNALIGTIPRQIGNLKQLTFLDLSRNELVGNLPKEIGKLINLKDGDSIADVAKVVSEEEGINGESDNEENNLGI